MKSCPTCNRTYADETLAFCLVDGSILSAPYDPEATQRIPPPRSTNPPPTETMPRGESSNNATLPSSGKSKGQKLLKGAIVGGAIGFVLGLIAVVLRLGSNSFDLATTAILAGIIIGALINLVRKG